jgi:hypothetical protein
MICKMCCLFKQNWATKPVSISLHHGQDGAVLGSGESNVIEPSLAIHGEAQSHWP